MTSYAWEAPGATALVVPFPELEPLIGRYRRAQTPSGAAGMVAHATLLAPFVHGSQLVDADVAAVADALAPFAAFRVRLASFGRFDDEAGTLYLEPEPRDRFVEMSEALMSAFPATAYPPDGAAEIVPHVTVASRRSHAELDRIEVDVARGLPVDTVVDRVVLFERAADGTWAEREVLELMPLRSLA